MIHESWIRPAGVTAGIILAIYFASLMRNLYRKDADPSGAGCLSVIAIVCAVVGLLLTVGFFFHINGLIWCVAVLVLVPAGFIVGNNICERIAACMKRRRG
ncbi:MAG TPA: hypothetical protein VH370_08795 [Humisphaera sp.]|jgi:hypothetical protein|nr:hypothetical protein [Humisphaera sp.]